ncbi:MAG: hypothetical protein HY366_00125 [Candidatus Aenigmarchaeota archaeon]|nr:hypothetical protein [Candidatus Aenigmarchaeota archaeon]
MKTKGLSPLIATVLLIAFTITVATFIAAFSQSFVRTQTQEFGQRSQELSKSCQFANLQLTAAVYDGGAGKVSVLARNVGTENLTDFRILTFTSDVDFVERTPSNANIALGSGEIATFSVANVTQTPAKVQIQSKQCPREAVYTCVFSGGTFLC